MADKTCLQGGGKVPCRAVGGGSQAESSLLGRELHGDLVMMCMAYGYCLSPFGIFSSMALLQGEKMWCLWFSLSNRCFLKGEKEHTAFLTAFESFKLLVVFG